MNALENAYLIGYFPKYRRLRSMSDGFTYSMVRDRLCEQQVPAVGPKWEAGLSDRTYVMASDTTGALTVAVHAPPPDSDESRRTDNNANMTLVRTERQRCEQHSSTSALNRTK